jgi:putative transposase
MKLQRGSKEYYSSFHLVYKCTYHVIFCPKYRHKILIGKVETKLKELLYRIAYDYDFIIEELEVMPDHVHILIFCNPRYGIMQCVQNIKSITAKELFREFPFIKKKYLWGGKFWSRSSFISTVGSVSLKTVKQYIENQKTN